MSVLKKSLLFVATVSTAVFALTEGQGLVAVKASAFTLERDVAGDARRASAIASLGELRVTLGEVLHDANRAGRRIRSVPGVDHFHVGFAWQDDDEKSPNWYPQGVAGGVVGDRKVLVASWYDRSDARGVRLSFADVTDLDRVRYRHVLLVEPVKSGGKAVLRPIPIHAGGLAWVGPYLYVADTSHGFRVFDTRELRAIPSNETASTFDYKYVLTQVSAWNLAQGSKKAVFSSVSVDRSTSPPSLVTCEYHKSDIEGRVFRWPLDAKGRLAASGRSVHPSEVYVAAHDRMQGVASWNGEWLLSCSSQQGSRGSLWAANPNKPSRERSWAYGCESLFVSSSGNLWSLTEQPGARFVFAARLADYR